MYPNLPFVRRIEGEKSSKPLFLLNCRRTLPPIYAILIFHWMTHLEIAPHFIIFLCWIVAVRISVGYRVSPFISLLSPSLRPPKHKHLSCSVPPNIKIPLSSSPERNSLKRCSPPPRLTFSRQSRGRQTGARRDLLSKVEQALFLSFLLPMGRWRREIKAGRDVRNVTRFRLKKLRRHNSDTAMTKQHACSVLVHLENWICAEQRRSLQYGNNNCEVMKSSIFSVAAFHN